MIECFILARTLMSITVALQVALRVGDAMNRRIRDAASPDEMKALKRYIDQCPTVLRQQLLVTYRSVMRERGREDVDMKTLIAGVGMVCGGFVYNLLFFGGGVQYQAYARVTVRKACIKCA